MRIAQIVIVVLLSLALPMEGEAQFQPRSLLADVVEMPSAQSAALAEYLRTQPRVCRGSLVGNTLAAALFGAFVGAVITFVGGMLTLVHTWGQKKFNGTPYVVGSAVVFGFLAAYDWQTRCAITDGAFP
jgi:hypothetical protein